MRGWLPGIAIAVGAAVFLVWGSLSETDSAPRLEPRSATLLASGTVASVVDGDTIRLADNRRLRLVQIDAPERRAGECYAERASQALTRLAPVGTGVTLHIDRALDRKDEHGRFLVYAFDGQRNLNLALVRQGAAAPYFVRGKRGRYADRLMDAARGAKDAGRGLWGACPRTELDPSRPVNAQK